MLIRGGQSGMMGRFSVKLNNLLFWIKAKMDERMVLLMAGSIVIMLYGDVVLGWIGSLLHYAIEVLELGLEHLIEATFHVSQRTAQILTAWTGLFLFLLLGWFIFRKTVSLFREWIALRSDRLNLHQTRISNRQRLAICASLLIAVILAIYFQF
ncbi:hypothetical protein [Methylocaldum sp. RMAD-M]|uniref:hypothetical protein n=2 Tax=Methylocaldum TaxID=73778 RepID=UPI001AE52705|nr:hypothetical protein [Methylocaldum sp. RMAD-M]